MPMPDQVMTDCGQSNDFCQLPADPRLRHCELAQQSARSVTARSAASRRGRDTPTETCERSFPVAAWMTPGSLPYAVAPVPHRPAGPTHTETLHGTASPSLL